VPDKESLAGRGAVITGAGRGIGEAVARRLAESGAAVLAVARTRAEVADVAESIRTAGGRAWAATCDVTDEQAVSELASEAVERLGQVDILVNNAGLASSAPIHRTSLEEWDRVLAVNATGAFLCTRAFLEPMVKRGHGRIVNMASVAGLQGARYIAAYAAAKHALLGLTRVTAAEVAGSGVTANAVCPAYVDTAMNDTSIARIVAKTGRSAEEARAAILKATPMGRLLTPGEVAAAVLYLCDESAGGVNGQALVIDGGAMHA
jgi:NAD(P)-dependent dehydrogenase (short-subunit alcohol dehydrogenase family)